MRKEALTPTEAEVVSTIKGLYPGLGDHAGYVLRNHTSFPFYDGDDPMEQWLAQVRGYVKASAEEWQRLHG